MSLGVISMGITCPIIKSGDNLEKIILDSILKTQTLQDGDVIGITESIVARAEGNYVTVDDIAEETKRLFGGNDYLLLLNPIYSRNRFSMILKGIARAVKHLCIVMPNYDEVGNPKGINPWTGVNIEDYYTSICTGENCECRIMSSFPEACQKGYTKILDCRLRPNYNYTNLTNYFYDKCEYGLLGSNKATEEKLKLFPSKIYSERLINNIQNFFKNKGVNVEVMIYGDGCFKDPDSDIWEFADPVTSPAYTMGLNGSPNEIKIKYFADNKFKDLKGKELEEAIKNEISSKEKSLVGNMKSEGTTPRRYVNLLASLMDLTSGSGDRGTPIIIVRNYFKNYSNV